jgi:hypothetical protein
MIDRRKHRDCYFPRMSRDAWLNAAAAILIVIGIVLGIVQLTG